MSELIESVSFEVNGRVISKHRRCERCKKITEHCVTSNECMSCWFDDALKVWKSLKIDPKKQKAWDKMIGQTNE